MRTRKDYMDWLKEAFSHDDTKPLSLLEGDCRAMYHDNQSIEARMFARTPSREELVFQNAVRELIPTALWELRQKMTSPDLYIEFKVVAGALYLTRVSTRRDLNILVVAADEDEQLDLYARVCEKAQAVMDMDAVRSDPEYVAALAVVMQAVLDRTHKGLLTGQTHYLTSPSKGDGSFADWIDGWDE